MTILITGGSGFIGTVLARQLKAAGHTIKIFDLKMSKTFPDDTIIGDVCDEAAMLGALKGCRAVYHLAAEHRDDVRPTQKYYDVNVNGAQILCNAAAAAGVKTIIFTSSVALYGLDAGASGQGSVETDAPKPFNDYGASKSQAEEVLNAWAAAAPDRSLTSTRLVATFGPGNRGNIYTLMDQIARGRFVMIGAGKNLKSIAYVENVAAFLQHCLQHAAPGSMVYNYADKPDLETRALVQTVRGALGMPGLPPTLPYALGLAGGAAFDIAARITGRNFPISLVRIQKFCAHTIVNADKARSKGFKAPYSLEQGLEAMIKADFLAKKKAA